ncbi:MAG TPA: hypothetical protein VK324_03190 [Tepidisphaeraceae bacterium]|nr:hypothetical protein [Tepidisphaeraceae bacterium]
MATLGYGYDNAADVPMRTSVQTRSIASIIAILSAIGSFYFSSAGRELVALLLAVVAIGAGLLGGLRALSPRVSGGILSIIAVLLGVIAIVVAVIALIV